MSETLTLPEALADNPLLKDSQVGAFELPRFTAIKPAHVEPAIRYLLETYKQTVDSVVAQGQYDWEHLVMPLEAVGDLLERAWSPVSHLNGVANTAALREAYEACLAPLSEFSTWIGQHEGLFKAYQALKESPEWSKLSAAQQRMVDNSLRDFRLAGVDLPDEQKQRYGAISQRLSELSNRFSNQLLDATQGWTRLVTEKAELAGLPDSAKASARALAESKNLQGWLFTLDFPSLFPVLAYCDNRQLREELYTANITRASEVGPQAGAHDNGPVMEEILALRQEQAKLLGFETYAERSLATKMARSPEEVLSFLKDLGKRSLPQARQEFDALQQWVEETYGLADLRPWDVTYYGEKLRESRYAISQEALRPWFPAPKVIEGLLDVASTLFDVSFEAIDEVETWHPDVRFYQVLRAGQPIAGFYLDLYAREGKRGGAWMDGCRGRRLKSDHTLQLPVAYLTCNFTAPVSGQPSLLTHDEVTTLFHEFGHGLHHMLTQVDVADVAGINGVAWDAVELPSQFMENFCWEQAGLAKIAGHIDTGEPLPDEMVEKLLAAKNFQSAMQMVRQLEFSLFDFRLHHELEAPKTADIQALLDEVRAYISVVPLVSFNRFQNSFGHIFAGGYAAGYYSYKWAEVLSADAYSAFEEEGTFNADTGRRFRECILEKGGSDDALNLFVAFRGREPQVDALLRHSGITEAQ